MVKHRNILAILRQLSETGPLETDAELLGRFAAHRDEEAFAALVRRHGRLVWAVCRHLAGPDADDAFQATFLVLLRNAGKIRKANNLSAWLHSVAYRVCSKARLSAKRRLQRERTVVVKEGNGSVVPDSAWDRAMAAVHEEVARLPETLRVPFVMCSLEGKSITEAAAQLGWKLGTLSGRLTRAKDALLARLDARGLTAGAVAALACTASTAPAEVLAKAANLVHDGLTVSSSILSLTQGVIGMSAYHVKMLAAGVLLACGLGLGGGAGWLANAEAQPPATPAAKMTPEEKVRQLEAQLEQAKKEVEDKKKERLLKVRQFYERMDAVRSTTKWDYNFVPFYGMDVDTFVKFLQEREALGWDYSGQMTLMQNGKDAPMWVFRRPAKKPLGLPQTNPNPGREAPSTGLPPGGQVDPRLLNLHPEKPPENPSEPQKPEGKPSGPSMPRP
jgi:RNA polymerase sigma factor (sigma-70 family)